MSTLRVGVVGLHAGAHHAQCFESHPKCEVVAICDVDEGTLASVGEKHPAARRYTSLTPPSKVADRRDPS